MGFSYPRNIIQQQKNLFIFRNKNCADVFKLKINKRHINLYYFTLSPIGQDEIERPLMGNIIYDYESKGLHFLVTKTRQTRTAVKRLLPIYNQLVISTLLIET